MLLLMAVDEIPTGDTIDVFVFVLLVDHQV